MSSINLNIKTEALNKNYFCNNLTNNVIIPFPLPDKCKVKNKYKYKTI